jgi:hypothetical protein
MITLIVFVSLFIVYVSIIFFRGVHREKRDKKLKKVDETLLEEETK